MRSHLNPTVITDKNGRTTTVHKKAEGPSAIVSSVPAPSLPSSRVSVLDEGIETYDEAVAKRVFDMMKEFNGGREVGMNKMIFVLNATNKQRELYADLLERRDGFGDIVAAATSGAFSDRERPGENEMLSIALIYDKDAFNELAQFSTNKKAAQRLIKFKAYRNTLTNAWREPAITGISTRKEAFRLGELSPETVNEVRSYMKLRAIVDKFCPFGEEPLGDLLDVALHSGEHSFDEVAEVVKTHRTRDANTVLGILNGSSTAVANGWL